VNTEHDTSFKLCVIFSLYLQAKLACKYAFDCAFIVTYCELYHWKRNMQLCTEYCFLLQVEWRYDFI